ncbi:hypothetical protein [Gorillibacterium sp. CAU 1737]|uniref:hypothetical protein n=1 Tax=Gorillibacterium sp. CAU 1737 TaxID=3140362 RepID=UPI0032608641
MPTIVDYQFREAAANTFSLPFPLTSGTEASLTTINLTATSATDRLFFSATVGWLPELLLLTPVLPTLTVRIRQGGSAPNNPVIFETTDSTSLGTGSLIPLLSAPITTSIHHTNVAGSAGSQSYFLTVELEGIGSASVSGPVHLSGMSISL